MNATRKTSLAAEDKDTTRLSDSLAETARDGRKAVQRGVEDVAQAARRGAEDAADAVKGKARDAGATLATMRDAAVEKADEARETLSEVGERIAASLHRATEAEDADALKSRVFHSVAEGLTRASTTLRQQSVADLTDDVRTLARRHPGAFMAAAAVAGFAAARFLRSSAQRRDEQALIAANRDRRA